ncbi:MAG: hypothetical protein DI604_20210 [Delftia acidovorans]|nr:MAG: hypothetical protein DI604_20210 [Delftia acidovorans]
MSLPKAFVWGRAGAQLTPDEIAQLREMEAKQEMQGADYSPVGHWTQGAARVANALAGVVRRNRLEGAATENANYNSGLMKQLMGGADPAPAPAATPSAMPTPSMGAQAAATAPAPQAASGATVASLGNNDIVQGVMDAAKPTEGAPTYLRYANQGATRSQPLNEKLVASLGFLPELGVTAEVFSGGQPAAGQGPRTGSTRHDHGNAADVNFYKDGRKLDWANPDDQPIFQEIVKRGKAAGLTGFGAGPGYMSAGSMHVGFGNPGVWGAGGKGANAPEWLRAAYGDLPASKPMPSYSQAMALAPAAQSSGVAAINAQMAPPLDAPRNVAAPVVPPQAAPAQPQPQQLAQAVRDRSQQLLGVMSDPRATENTKRIAQALYQQEQQRIQAAQERALKLQDRNDQWAREDRRFAVTDNREASRDALSREKFAFEKENAANTSDIREYNFAKQQGYQGTFAEYQTQMRKAGAASNNVNVGGGSDKQVFDEMKSSYDSARTAASGLNSLREARKAVEGGAILGIGADNRLALQKIGAQLGVTNPDAIINTETFRSAIAPQVAALMKQTVGSTQISNSDREFAEKAAGGSIALEKGTITRLLDIMERANTEVVKNHADRLNRVYPEGQSFDRERALFGIAVPEAPAPVTAPQQNGPKAGDVEGGFMFKGGDPSDPKSWEKIL